MAKETENPDIVVEGVEEEFRGASDAELDLIDSKLKAAEEENRKSEEDIIVDTGDKVDGSQKEVEEAEQEVRESDDADTEDADENVFGENDESEDGSPGDEIDEGFIDAAREAGWSDKDIQDFASNYGDNELKDMIPYLSPSEEKEVIDPEPEKKIEDETASKEKTEVDIDKIEDPVVRKVVEDNKRLQQELDSLKETKQKWEENVEKEAALREQQKLRENYRIANETFDEFSDKFGKTDDLPKFPDGRLVPTSPQFKAREEVWGKALLFHEKLGMDFKEAMGDAMKLWKGGNEKEVGRKLLRQMKDNEKRLTPKRSGKKVTEGKVYDNPDDEKADIVRQAARQAGVTIE